MNTNTLENSLTLSCPVKIMDNLGPSNSTFEAYILEKFITMYICIHILNTRMHITALFLTAKG